MVLNVTISPTLSWFTLTLTNKLPEAARRMRHWHYYRTDRKKSTMVRQLLRVVILAYAGVTEHIIHRNVG